MVDPGIRQGVHLRQKSRPLRRIHPRITAVLRAPADVALQHNFHDRRVVVFVAEALERELDFDRIPERIGPPRAIPDKVGAEVFVVCREAAIRLDAERIDIKRSKPLLVVE